jgi:hypothetical protein
MTAPRKCRQVGKIALGDDPVAADATCARRIFDPLRVRHPSEGASSWATCMRIGSRCGEELRGTAPLTRNKGTEEK